MTEIEYILTELQRGHAGEPWHGSSRAAVLADVTAEVAARRPGVAGEGGGGPHSIWEVVLHMRAWTREVARRVKEGAPREPTEGDWPPVDATSEAAWRAAIKSLTTAHAEVCAAIRDLRTEQLDALVGGAVRDASVGTGVTHREMLYGLAQHDAYHTGQIALLKRLYRGAEGGGRGT